MFEDSFQSCPSFLLFTAQGDRTKLGETSGLSHTARKAKEAQSTSTTTSTSSNNHHHSHHSHSFRPTSALYTSTSVEQQNDITSSSSSTMGGGAVGGAGEKISGTVKKEYDKVCRSFTYSIRAKNSSVTIPSNDKKACKDN